MPRVSPCLALFLLALLLSCDIHAADYVEGLAPPGAPASGFPAPSRPVARIVTDIWHDEQSRDQAGEAERVMNLLGVTTGLTIAAPGGSNPRGMSSPKMSFPSISSGLPSESRERV